MTDANGVTTEYVYDDTNRLRGVDSAGTDADVSFSYDAGGRRTGMTDAIGTTTWDYDDLNRPISITDPFQQVVGYSYDAAGNRTGLAYAGKQVGYTYDTANRLTNVNDSTLETVYQYDPTGRLASILLPNGVNTTYSYDEAGRLVQIRHAADDESELISYQYTYDAAGNRIQAVESRRRMGTGPTVHLTVVDSSGNLLSGKEVYAFNGETYSDYHKATDASGQVALTLPEGEYRFRVDVDGTQFWSGTENHCTIGDCDNLLVTVPVPVMVVINDSDGSLQENIPVYAFVGDQYSGYNGITNTEGALMLRLPQGEYRFRADSNGTQFWSGETCAVPNCEIIPITITQPTLLTVRDNIGSPHEGISVYAFDGATYTGKHGTTDENGEVSLTLPEGNYRFRADFNGTQFWSGTENHCVVPECSEAEVNITLPLTVTVMNIEGEVQEELPVYAFDGSTYTGYHGTTDAAGLVSLTLPEGNYRFRVDFNGTQFWSDTQNHCAVPDCSGAQVVVTYAMPVTVQNVEGEAKAGVTIYAFNNETYTGYHGTTDTNGQTAFTLPQGSYRFRADLNGTQFWSGASNHCDVPGCLSASVTTTNSISVTVQDIEGTAKADVHVYAFNGSAYTGYNGVTDTDGRVTLTLPQGSYRFRADYNGTQFWSTAVNQCEVPICSDASVTVTNGLLVIVQDTDGTAKEGLKVYAFNGSTYSGYSSTTDADGQAAFTLPQGSYRFRADLDGTQFWSGATNHCDVPGCGSASVTVTNPVIVTVQDTDGAAKAGLKVYAFNGLTYTGYNGTTDAAGQVTLTLQQGSYRFRSDLNGTQFWSNASNHCAIPSCTSAGVMVTNPITLSVQTADGMPQSGIKVYAFNGSTYTGYNGTTNAAGQVTLTLQQGNYRFRADFNGTQYWSDSSNHCPVPGCAEGTVIVGSQPTATATPLLTDTATPVPTDMKEPTAEPSPTPITTETPFALQSGDFSVSFGKSIFAPRQTGLENGAGLLGEYFDNGMDLNDVPLFTRLDSQLDYAWYDSSPMEGTVPGDFTARWSGQIEIPISDEYVFAVLADDLTRIWIDGELYIDGWDNSQAFWREGAAISLVGGQKYDIRIEFRDTGGLADLHLNWYTPAGDIEWWQIVPTRYLYPPAGLTLATVSSTEGVPLRDLTVRVFDGETDTGLTGVTNVNGQMLVVLPDGSYRLVAERNGESFWSGETNHCTVPGCDQVEISIPVQYDSIIEDEFDSETLDSAWTWFAEGGEGWSLTNDPGFLQIIQPSNFNLTRSDMGTGDFVIETTFDFGTQVSNEEGFYCYELQIGFSDDNELGFFVYNADVPIFFHTGYGEIAYGLPDFTSGFLRIEKVGAEYSAYYKENASNRWTYLASLTTTASTAVRYVGLYGSSYSEKPVIYNVDRFRLQRRASTDVAMTVNVSNADGEPQEGLTLHVFDNEVDTGMSAITDEYGRVNFVLPQGSYRFGADLNGRLFWSGATNHCDLSACNQFNFVIPRAISVGVVNNQWESIAGVTVYAFSGDPSTSSGPVYLGYEAVTDENGQAFFTLSEGEDYRFRADYTAPGAGNSHHFWSSWPEMCNVPGCEYAEIMVPEKPVTVTTLNANGDLLKNLKVYAFKNEEYTGHSLVTDGNGQAAFTLPEGESYYFRTNFSDPGSATQSPETCDVPNCDHVEVTVAMKSVTVTVRDTDSTPKEGLNVYVFDDDRYSGYHLSTDANGQVTFTLPISAYRFRTDLNGTKFWSGAENHCVADCEAAEITVTKPMTVSVLSGLDTSYPDLPVYAFHGTIYTGYHAITDANGQVTMTLPQGNYRFRTDINGTQFWSSTENTCTIPGCASAEIAISGGLVYEVTIDYTYDPLYRLTGADYSNGDGYAYTYDAVGNRLTQESTVYDLSSTSTYNYDIANRLADVNGAAYTYDANGNLLNDGVNAYTYDPANRLSSVNSGQLSVTSYQYNGLGDRLSQNGVNYTLDLNTGLTQVLSDGTTTYTYGLGRISQTDNSTAEYFLGDALGSVRQLTSQSGAVTYAASYDPYGVVTQSGGTSNTEYGFTGEATSGDSTQLIFLRARWYNPTDGRFQSRDTWGGDDNSPQSFNRWMYAFGNPLRFIDPTGHYNREVAVNFALSHDLMDPFVEGENFRDARGWTDCAAFASSVISRGGVEDTRGAPPYEFKDMYNTGNPQNWYDDYVNRGEPSYWNREWAETLWDTDAHKHYGIHYTSWMNVQGLYDFLTREKHYESFTITTSNLKDDLRNHKEQIMKGDLVFYEGFSHVAVIVSPSAPQTFFGGFKPHEEAVKNGRITTWTDYLVFGGAAENQNAFAEEALEVWKQTQCDGAYWFPRVVERSGGILYHGSRSINNTITPQNSFTIVHIK